MIALNVMTIILDILWILTMRSVWAGKPAKNANQWKAFSNIRGIVIFLSFVNVVIKGAAVSLLFYINKANQQLMGQRGRPTTTTAF